MGHPNVTFIQKWLAQFILLLIQRTQLNSREVIQWPPLSVLCTYIISHRSAYNEAVHFALLSVSDSYTMAATQCAMVISHRSAYNEALHFALLSVSDCYYILLTFNIMDMIITGIK